MIDKNDTVSYNPNELLGRVNIGWTIGEEILFSNKSKDAIRHETCWSETDSCLLGIDKYKLTFIQKNLFENGNSKDYFVLESVLKGNNLLKQKWKNNMLSDRVEENLNSVANVSEIKEILVNS